MWYADVVGLDQVLADMERFYAETGDEAWKPAKLLELGERGQNTRLSRVALHCLHRWIDALRFCLGDQGGIDMDEFKGRWQALQSEDAGSHWLAVRSLALSLSALWQGTKSRSIVRSTGETPLGSPRGERGFDGHPPVTMDGESALAGSKTWVPGAPYIDTVMIRVGRGQDSIFAQIDLPCGGVTTALGKRWLS